jgi:polyisoprenoid-binding protein YceI
MSKVMPSVDIFCDDERFIHLAVNGSRGRSASTPDPTLTARVGLLAVPALASTTATDGVWKIGSGSIAGFRSQVSVLGHMTSIVGHSTALIGSIQLVRGDVVAGSFRIDLASLQIFGKSNAGLKRMIDTTRYPAASFILNGPIPLTVSPLKNVTYSAPATGSLAMHGATRPVTFVFTARYTGTCLEAAGSIAVAYSDWNLKAPFGIQNNGAIDFTLRMSRVRGRTGRREERP